MPERRRIQTGLNVRRVARVAFSTRLRVHSGASRSDHPYTFANRPLRAVFPAGRISLDQFSRPLSRGSACSGGGLLLAQAQHGRSPPIAPATAPGFRGAWVDDYPGAEVVVCSPRGRFGE